MITYFLRRLFAIPLVLIASFLPAFLLVHAAPDGPYDPWRRLPPAVEAALASRCDLEEGLLLQLASSLSSWLQLEVDDCTGLSLRDGSPVLTLVAGALPTTLKLALLALLVAVALGLVGGILAARAPTGIADRGARAAIAVVAAIPAFVLAPFFVLVGALWLPLFPPARFLDGAAWIVPALALGLAFAAGVARVVRDALTAPEGAARRRAAISRGATSSRAALRALHLALLPVASGLVPMTSAVMMGGIAVERVFDLPGLGPLVIAAALARDYNLLLGGVLAYAALLMLMNLAFELLYGALDPRVRGSRP